MQIAKIAKTNNDKYYAKKLADSPRSAPIIL